jgi:hypothetical protein
MKVASLKRLCVWTLISEKRRLGGCACLPAVPPARPPAAPLRCMSPEGCAAVLGAARRVTPARSAAQAPPCCWQPSILPPPLSPGDIGWMDTESLLELLGSCSPDELSCIEDETR